jgi:arginine deiminase
MLHPAASLFKDVTTGTELNKNFEHLKVILNKHKIKMLTVRECLKINRDSLEKFAATCLNYVAENPEDGSNCEKFQYYMSDDYKMSVIRKLDSDQLVDMILSQPTFKLRYTEINTNVEFVDISFKPLGNLIYVRDQQIITQKGVLMGKFNAYVREIESGIMRKVFENIGVKIIGEVPNGALLEGGDFMILRPDLAVLGIGMRTNFEAAIYLMENDLIGCDRLALIIDDNDYAQERMHLDTFFNILKDKTVILLDFHSLGLKNNKPMHRRVVVYEKDKENFERKNSGDKNKDIDFIKNLEIESQTYGNYRLKEKFDCFDDYLIKENFKICYCSLSQQLDYITNFLNVGNNTVISVCTELKRLLDKYNIHDVHIDHLHFEGVKNLYGAIHCASQVSRKRMFDVDNK